LAAGTAATHSKLNKLLGQGPTFLLNGSLAHIRCDGIDFAQLESPHFSLAAEKRVGGKFSGAGKLQHLTPRYAEKLCDCDGGSDLSRGLLLRADNIVSNLLGNKIALAKRLAREYAEIRKIGYDSPSHRSVMAA
jgi:hypothetical protein